LVEVVSLSCNECGAPLEVSDKARFVTCKKCKAQLAIKHDDGAVYTELAEAAKRVEDAADALEEHAQDLKAQNDRFFVQGEIERLDREWEQERSGLMQRTKSGQTYAPQRSQAVVLAVLPLLLFVFPVMFPFGDLTWIVWAGTIVISLVLWFACYHHYQRAIAYEAAEASFRVRRDELVAQLERGD
jgi:Flp pilus assembly protein TadB